MTPQPTALEIQDDPDDKDYVDDDETEERSDIDHDKGQVDCRWSARNSANRTANETTGRRESASGNNEATSPQRLIVASPMPSSSNDSAAQAPVDETHNTSPEGQCAMLFEMYREFSDQLRQQKLEANDPKKQTGQVQAHES